VKAARAPKFAPNPAARAMIAKLHIARKDLGLSEDDYRAVLLRETGKRSAGDMTLAELDKALSAFTAQGWKAKAGRTVVTFGGGKRIGRTAAAADHPSARKARAMWISLWNLGAVRNSSETALETFAARQLGVERMQWADQAKCYKLIEALKAMAERAGWNQTPSPQATEQSLARELMQRLIVRQCEILREAGDPRPVAEIANSALPDPARMWMQLPIGVHYGMATRLGHSVREARAR
jgi:phage gp16-like protein